MWRKLKYFLWLNLKNLLRDLKILKFDKPMFSGYVASKVIWSTQITRFSFSFFLLLRDLIKVWSCFIFIILKNTSSKMIKIPVQVHSSQDKENDNAIAIKKPLSSRAIKLLSVDIYIKCRIMARVWRKLPLFLEQFSYVHYSHINKGLIQIVSTLLLKYNKYRRQHK